MNAGLLDVDLAVAADGAALAARDDRVERGRVDRAGVRLRCACRSPARPAGKRAQQHRRPAAGVALVVGESETDVHLRFLAG